MITNLHVGLMLHIHSVLLISSRCKLYIFFRDSVLEDFFNLMTVSTRSLTPLRRRNAVKLGHLVLE